MGSIETEFTPYASFFGGLLIGLAAVGLMGSLGRIFGATGVLAGLVMPASGQDALWRGVLVAGMVSGPLLVYALSGQMPVLEVPISMPMLIFGGLLVGVGVTFGGGCTSGHGVCGMARFSTRSIVATLTFMCATGITVFVVRHVIGG